jgi:hypothetical protein
VFYTYSKKSEIFFFSFIVSDMDANSVHASSWMFALFGCFSCWHVAIKLHVCAYICPQGTKSVLNYDEGRYFMLGILLYVCVRYLIVGMQFWCHVCVIFIRLEPTENRNIHSENNSLSDRLKKWFRTFVHSGWPSSFYLVQNGYNKLCVFYPE